MSKAQPLKPRFLKLFFVLLVLIAGFLIWQRKDVPSPEPATSTKFNKTQHSIKDPASLWVVVNKGRQLPSSYTPSNLASPAVQLRSKPETEETQLSPETTLALQTMFNNAKTVGLNLMLVSGYRSYNLQKIIYNRHVSQYGMVEANKTSAKAGHSEHQTGLAADVGTASRQCELQTCFGDLPEGKWLADNAYKYGFIVRYPAESTSLTGYSYEPWHLRYVGIQLAQQLQRSQQTMEQFFGLPIIADYPANIYQLGSN